jgi:hypothetical protein
VCQREAEAFAQQRHMPKANIQSVLRQRELHRTLETRVTNTAEHDCVAFKAPAVLFAFAFHVGSLRGLDSHREDGLRNVG